MTNNHILGWLQSWYQEQCNGDWEHVYGVKIETLDNPGWAVRIELKDTELEDIPFPEIRQDKGDSDWLVCSVKDDVFYGYGDPYKLTVILEIFRNWAENSPEFQKKGAF